MNKIIKKLRIPGYETKMIIKRKKNETTKQVEGVQLSFDIDMESRKSDKIK